MKKVLLEEILLTMESGSRPKGGVGQIASGVLSLGAEHLDGKGGFYLESPKYVPQEFYSQLSKGKVSKNDILIVKDGATTGKVSFVDGLFDGKDVSINEHVFRLAVKLDRAEPRYVFHYLSSTQGKAEILSDFRGATVGGISRGFTSRVSIPLPPLPEQRRIATILDKADAIRRKRQEAIKLTEELGRSIFLDMFGDPVTNSMGWKTECLGELGNGENAIVDGPFGSSVDTKIDYIPNGEIPVIRSKNIRPFEFITV
jgi:type I restriction enzyme S subunit